MSFVIEQKIKGHVYFYEVTSYWDKEKQQSRQKRTYLGKKDPKTSEAVTPRKLPTVSTVFDYGHLYLVAEQLKSLGLKEALFTAFGEQTAKTLLSLLFFQVVEAKPFSLYASFRESVSPDSLVNMSSQRISEFLHEIGGQSERMASFFQQFAVRQGPMKGVFLDITSISSYSEQNPFVEWGYNRDGEALAQVNLAVLVGGPNKLPFFYQLYPGSIPDVSTLHNLALRAKDLGFSIETFVMDRGFFSTSNLANLSNQSLGFLIPLPLSLTEARRLLVKSQTALRFATHTFCLGKEALFYQDTKATMGPLSLRACVYLSEKRRALETETLLRKLESLEQAVATQTFENLAAAKHWLFQQWKGSVSLFSLSLSKKGVLSLTRKRKALSLHMRPFGKMVLLTNRWDLTPKELLSLYRQRDSIEKVYDTLKQEMNEDRLRTHGQHTMEGKMFVTFLSLIVHTALKQTMNQKDSPKPCSVEELMMELKKIRLITRTQNQPPLLTEISKRQRLIFEHFHIPLPSPTSLLTLTGF